MNSYTDSSCLHSDWRTSVYSTLKRKMKKRKKKVILFNSRLRFTPKLVRAAWDNWPFDLVTQNLFRFPKRKKQSCAKVLDRALNFPDKVGFPCVPVRLFWSSLNTFFYYLVEEDIDILIYSCHFWWKFFNRKNEQGSLLRNSSSFLTRFITVICHLSSFASWRNFLAF